MTNATIEKIVKGLYSIYDIAVSAFVAKSVQKMENSSAAAINKNSVCIL